MLCSFFYIETRDRKFQPVTIARCSSRELRLLTSVDNIPPRCSDYESSVPPLMIPSQGLNEGRPRERRFRIERDIQEVDCRAQMNIRDR